MWLKLVKRDMIREAKLAFLAGLINLLPQLPRKRYPCPAPTFGVSVEFSLCYRQEHLLPFLHTMLCKTGCLWAVTFGYCHP